MFPFSYNKRIIVSGKGEQEINIDEIRRKFLDQFDNPRLTDHATITFDNFNFFLKRHQWLSNGVLKITQQSNHVVAELHLRFHIAALILAVSSIGLLATDIDQLVAL